MKVAIDKGRKVAVVDQTSLTKEYCINMIYVFQVASTKRAVSVDFTPIFLMLSLLGILPLMSSMQIAWF